MATSPSKILERFPNPERARDYEIVFDCPEMTCLCPLTGQPDFARIEIRYVPDRFCVESKSLKNYIWSYRNEGAFHEKVTNTICDDLVAALGPRKMTVTGWWNIRGGISTVVVVNHEQGKGKRIPLRADVGQRGPAGAPSRAISRGARSRASGGA
jgi:7-cyano-7-deazaguanine reductase